LKEANLKKTQKKAGGTGRKRGRLLKQLCTDISNEAEGTYCRI